MINILPFLLLTPNAEVPLYAVIMMNGMVWSFIATMLAFSTYGIVRIIRTRRQQKREEAS